MLCQAKAIDRAVDADGIDIPITRTCDRVLTEAVASTAAYTLEGVMNGTAQGARIFDGVPVFGKTGTAQRPPKGDQAWYVAYVPHATKPVVIAVTVEEGGFGAESAAPITRLMLSEWFGVEKRVVRGQGE